MSVGFWLAFEGDFASDNKKQKDYYCDTPCYYTCVHRINRNHFSSTSFNMANDVYKESIAYVMNLIASINDAGDIMAPATKATAVFEKKFAKDFACSLFKTISTII